jgi:CelD/BcsL family acetyltransferase involved in cellulose biosynthesis
MQINVTLEPLPSHDVLEALWRDLEVLADTAFYTSWTWISSWVRVLPADVTPKLLIARLDGRVIGLGIVINGRAKLLKIIQVQCWYLHATGLATIDELTMEYNGFLVEKDRGGDIMHAMLQHLLHQTAVGRVEIQLASAQFDAVARQAALAPVRARSKSVIVRSTSFPSYMVELAQVRASSKGYLSLLSSNTRSQIKRSMTAYEELGPLIVEEASTIEQAQAFLKELRKLHGATWLGRGERAGFSFSPTTRQFHDLLITDGFARGEVQLLRLSAGGQDIGYLYNLVHRGRVIYYQSGLRYGVLPKHDRPGLVCHTLAITHNSQAGHRCYDFAAGNYRYKDSLCTHKEPQHTHVFQRDGWLPRLDRNLRTIKAQAHHWRDQAQRWLQRIL